MCDGASCHLPQVPHCLTANGISVVALDTDAAVTGDLLQLLHVRAPPIIDFIIQHTTPAIASTLENKRKPCSLPQPPPPPHQQDSNSDVATILDDQRSLSQLVPLEHFYGLDPRVTLGDDALVTPAHGHSFAYTEGPLLTGLVAPELMADPTSVYGEGVVAAAGLGAAGRRALAGAGAVGGVGAGAAWGGSLAAQRSGRHGGGGEAGGAGGRHLLKKKGGGPRGTPGIDLPILTPSPVTDVMAWGLPWSPDELGSEAIGGPGARLGQCLGCGDDSPSSPPLSSTPRALKANNTQKD